MRKAAVIFVLLTALAGFLIFRPPGPLPPEEKPRESLKAAHLFPQGEEVDIESHIALELNSQPEPESLQEGFSIQPDLPGRLEVEGLRVLFIPDSPLDYQTRYRITLAQGIQCLQGSVLEEAVILEFTTRPRPPLKLYAVGDIMLDQLTNRRLKEYDPHYPFTRVRDILTGGDVVFGNLESPISRRGKPLPGKKYAFRAAPFSAAALEDGGINLLSLANNHILDYGVEALEDTLQILDEKGIHHAGAGRNREEAHAGTIMEAKGYRVGLLAYTDDLAVPPAWRSLWRPGPDSPGAALLHDRERIRKDIQKMGEQVDLLLVSFHWGREYTYNITAGQRELGRLAVDAGAHMVLGHHPHVPQGVEIYRGKPIIYSLGNFIFYPFPSYPTTLDTFILEAVFCQEGLASLALLPVRGGNSQPYLPEGREGEKLTALLARLLTGMGTSFTLEGGRLEVELP